jgi:hypothetical protein
MSSDFLNVNFRELNIFCAKEELKNNVFNKIIKIQFDEDVEPVPFIAVKDHRNPLPVDWRWDRIIIDNRVYRPIKTQLKILEEDKKLVYGETEIQDWK